MPSQNWARITIALAAIVSAVMVLVTGGSGAVSLNTAKIVISASSIVTILLLAFDRFLWRWPGVRRLHKRPVLRGTWKTELRTTYEERKDEVIDCFLVIDQTFSRICARMLFDRSRSNSMSGDIVRENGRCVLYYIFRSDKNALAPDTNPPARGAADLTIASTPMTHLEGDYWMERGTKGTLRTVGFSTALFDTFAAAAQADYTSGGAAEPTMVAM